MKKMAGLYAMFLTAMTLMACDNQYIERKDTLTLGAGDAVAANMGAHIQDPFPRHAANDRIPMDGVKAETALMRYRTTPSPGLGAPAGFASPAPVAPVSAR